MINKRKVLFLFILGILIFNISYISAQTIPNPTNKYINDFAGMFSAPENSYVQTLLQELEQNTTAEVVLVTIADCGGDYMGYAYNLATAWKIGKKDKSNGFLILYCQTEKRLVAQTGYGLEGILPDSKIGRIMDEFYVPQRDNGSINQGILDFTTQITQVIEDNRVEVLSGQAGASNTPDYSTIIFWMIIVYFLISRIMRSAYKNKKRKDWPWFIPIFIPFPSNNRTSGFGSGFSGGGFSGFNGGGFGGGGASR